MGGLAFCAADSCRSRRYALLASLPHGLLCCSLKRVPRRGADTNVTLFNGECRSEGGAWGWLKLVLRDDAEHQSMLEGEGAVVCEEDGACDG